MLRLPPLVRPFALSLSLLQLPLMAQGADHATEPRFTLPAFTAFASPDPNAMRRADDGSVRHWQGTLSFHGWFARPGEVQLALQLLKGAAPCTLELRCGEQVLRAAVAKDAERVEFGIATLALPGYHTFALRCTDGTPPGFDALLLHGPACRDAHFSTVERRNAASVHLGYDVPKDARDAVEWFYCEVTPRTDPLWTYYMATGWHRGYFGMQVNSKTERRLIFSVWDSGNEAVDRQKVAAEDRVQLVAKGDGVVANDFGNEGTGGHSHLVRDWQVDTTTRFLVHAEPDGTHTTYTGYCWFPERERFVLIASFRAPKDGGFLRGLYSFNENFAGQNGDLLRRCEFGNQWVRTRDGRWLPLLEARFTHDETGKRDRRDRSGGVVADRFYLQNGGFVADDDPSAVTRGGDRLRREAGAGTHPTDSELPVPPKR